MTSLHIPLHLSRTLFLLFTLEFIFYALSVTKTHTHRFTKVQIKGFIMYLWIFEKHLKYAIDSSVIVIPLIQF